MANLELSITGFENSQGNAMVALINSKDAYMDEDHNNAYEAYTLKIYDNKVIRLIPLPYGQYAIQVIHDKNKNGKLDRRIFGIPSERYGFSNNVKGKIGLPEYEEVVFTVDSPQMKIQIKME